MPVFLDEEMMGRDAARVGFPHLLVCMGFVAQTNNDLWGVHLTTAGAHSQAAFAAFWQWAQGKGLAAGAITDIYGCCNRTIRYGGLNPHVNLMDEMESFARVLGWHGSGHGFDTSILDPRNGTYVEYRRQLAGLCRIFYKLHEETESARVLQFHDSPAADIRQYISPGGSGTSGFKKSFLAKTGMVTTTESGPLHEVDYALRLATVQI